MALRLPLIVSQFWAVLPDVRCFEQNPADVEGGSSANGASVME
jgi:hypothetical protein